MSRYEDELPRLESEETELRQPIARLLPIGLVVDEPTLQPEDSLEYDVGPALRQRAQIPSGRPVKRRRGWGRTIAVLAVLTVILGAVFAMMGGAGAVVVAGGAVAGWLLFTTPVIDVQLPMPAPGAAPAGQGQVDAELVVMPDPGFRPVEPTPGRKKLGSSLP